MTEINPTFTAGKTHIISTEITLTRNLVLPENVTLIFQGGRFVSDNDVEIIGNNTALVAPIVCVFGKNIRATGSWAIDVAYPQWFENIYFYTPKDGKDIYPDMAAPINKAINMKVSGRVELIAGDYYITEPIYIPVGIHLNGVSSQGEWRTAPPLPPSTRLLPATKDETGELEYSHSHLIFINARGDGQIKKDQPNPWVAMSHITILSYPKVLMPPMSAVYVAGGVTIDMVHWINFPQAIEFMDYYSDAKVIRNCNYSVYDLVNIPKNILADRKDGDRYAFNLQGLGDALVFENNHVGDGRPMLYINHCDGGCICNNILNGDVAILNSKAIEMSTNHMENGPQILIKGSVVNISENFIEKGPRPSLLILNNEIAEHNTNNVQVIVSMTGDQFAYYNVDRDGATPEDKSTKEHRLNETSEYDILIDRTATVSIDNVYRYNFVVGASDVLPLGIKIGTIVENDSFEFNNYSYFASVDSRILRNEHLQASATFYNLNEPRIYTAQSVRWVDWFAESGVYRYRYRVVWDLKRQIVKNISGQTMFDINTPIILTKYGQGVLLPIDIGGSDGDNLNESFNFMLELYREKLDEDDNVIRIDRVFIPNCGCRSLYDNGISICGYKWKPIMLLPTHVASTTYDMYSFVNGHVQCAAKSKSTSGLSQWNIGDIIYNSGDDPLWSLIIKR